MPKPPDYAKLMRRARKKELSVVYEKGAIWKVPGLLNKVEKFAGKFGFPLAAVKAKFEKDKMFAAWFAKDPAKQKIHENAAAEYISSFSQISDFVALRNSGPTSVKVTSDGVFQIGGHENLPGKTLDFRWTMGGIIYYAMHKYTAESGGSQDGQFQEMLELMQRFLKSADPKFVLVLIMDGDYYKRNNGAKMAELRRLEKPTPPISKVLSIDDLSDFLDGQPK